MELKDKILNFRRFALTNSTSIYGEDSKTAQELLIRSAEKVAECMDMVLAYGEAIENMQTYIDLNYNGDTEELKVTVETAVKELKEQVNKTYACIYDEDSESAIELAGNTARIANECVKTCNMLGDLILNVNTFISMNYDPELEMLSIGGEENE